MSKRVFPKFNWDFAKRFVGESLLSAVFNYVEGDPDTNIPRLLGVFEKITPIPEHKEYIRFVTTNYQNNPAVRNFFNKIFTEIDRNVRDRLLCSAIINTMLLSHPRRREIEAKTGVHVPYTILIDPTSACNLKCAGCWAAEYNKHDQLEPELMDRILNEAKELGIYGIVLSGGEPFVYPYLLDMAQKHSDMAFMIYTNGTKIDEQVADRLRELGNISPAISLEGWEEVTDARRITDYLQPASVGLCITSPPYWNILRQRRTPDGIPVPQSFYTIHFVGLAVVIGAFGFFAYNKEFHEINKREGIILLLIYAAYLAANIFNTFYR